MEDPADLGNDLQAVAACANFERALAAAGRGVFLVDYDGTLAPFVTDSRKARAYPGVAAALDALVETDRARVVIVTGRFLREAPPKLETRAVLEIWGSHGRERLQPDGRYEVTAIDEHAARALAEADAWGERVAAAGGHCEAKPGCLAFHWRGAGLNQVVRIRHLVTEYFEREALEDVLELRSFDGGMELRAPGPDKGDVVNQVIAESPPGTPVAYLGDDLTDEDAFRALRGRGLGVLVRSQWRKSGAGLWVRPPESLLCLLHRWRQCLEAA